MMLLDIQGLGHKFGSQWVFRHVDLQIQTGRPVALIGANGAGKTTLFSLICGYLQPTEGQISVVGHTPGSPPTFGRLGALPQDASLDASQRINDILNLFGRLQGLSKKQAQWQTQHVLELVGLADRAYCKPGELSHGMRKRAAIAQSLIGQPPLILLDEPTAGLDPQNARQLRSLIQDLSDQTTFFISSHNLNELEELCDRILILQKGQLQEHQKQPHTSNGQLLTVTFDTTRPDTASFSQGVPPAIERIMPMGKRQLQFHIRAENDFEAAKTVLGFLQAHDWQWRQLTRGVPLEHALYGEKETLSDPDGGAHKATRE